MCDLTTRCQSIVHTAPLKTGLHLQCSLILSVCLVLWSAVISSVDPLVSFPRSAREDRRAEPGQELRPGLSSSRHHERRGLLLLLHREQRLRSDVSRDASSPGGPGGNVQDPSLQGVLDVCRYRVHLRGLTCPSNTHISVTSLTLSPGICPVSRPSLVHLLSKTGKGNAVVIIIGGAAESLSSCPGANTHTVVVKDRKGFVRVALEFG